MMTVQEANERRHSDIVSIAQTILHMRGPHDDQAIVEAIERAVRDTTTLTPMTEGERLAAVCELFRRYGVA